MVQMRLIGPFGHELADQQVMGALSGSVPAPKTVTVWRIGIAEAGRHIVMLISLASGQFRQGCAFATAAITGDALTQSTCLPGRTVRMLRTLVERVDEQSGSVILPRPFR